MVLNVAINYWAVLVATLIQMVLGSLWYSKIMFGKKWMSLSKCDPNDKDLMAKMKKGSNKAMLGMLIAAFVMSYILAHFIFYTNAMTFSGGMQAGFWLWLGFVATVTASLSLFERRPWGLWLITNGFYIVALLITGGLLAVWR